MTIFLASPFPALRLLSGNASAVIDSLPFADVILSRRDDAHASPSLQSTPPLPSRRRHRSSTRHSPQPLAVPTPSTTTNFSSPAAHDDNALANWSVLLANRRFLALFGLDKQADSANTSGALSLGALLRPDENSPPSAHTLPVGGDREWKRLRGECLRTTGPIISMRREVRLPFPRTLKRPHQPMMHAFVAPCAPRVTPRHGRAIKCCPIHGSVSFL